jgi:hypothetical protein
MVKQDEQRDLLGEIAEFRESTYANFDLNRLVSFTVHWLQQRDTPTTFENIVVAAFRMFPTKFALEGYPTHPDAARVNRALLQLRPKYRNWARGSVRKGFVLTESGLTEVRRVADALAGLSVAEQPAQKRQTAPRTMDLSQDLASVGTSSLFAKWQNQGLDKATVLEFLDMLNAYAYTPPRALRERLAFLENASLQVGRQDIFEFLREARKTFSQQLRDDRGE